MHFAELRIAEYSLTECAWLVQVVQAIQPGAMPGLRQAFTQSMNVVIRKELRLYASSLRKAAAASIASSPAEPDMGMANKRVDKLHPRVSFPKAFPYSAISVDSRHLGLTPDFT